MNLRNRKESIVEAHERLEEATVDPRRGRRHPFRVAVIEATECNDNAPLNPSNTVLLGL
jgi:hypothetical protein